MAEPCVLDTDVVSYIYRGDSRALAFRPILADAVPLVSFMTIAELERWALHRNWGPRRRMELTTFLDRFSIVMVDRVLCRVWAEVADRARRNGRPIQVADAWVAATALSRGVMLLTNNRADFAGVDDLRLYDPSHP